MGTKRMGSQGDSGSRGVNNTVQEPRSQALARQGSSLYNLTLDEVQNQLGDLGKPFSSMNLDELLRTVWNVEANQAANIGPIDYAAAAAAAGSSAPSLTPSLTRDLSKKTVDEVWQEIQQEQRNITGPDRLNERQQTLGEITLEDFLVKAGAVAESSSRKGNSNPPIGINETIQNIQHQQQQWMSYQVPPIHQQQQQQNMNAVFMTGQTSQQTSANPMLDASYPESLMGTLSDTQTTGRKRVASGEVVVERTVERRQKRMIKNRESAARSRARKQAYTHELENKVSRLEEENEKLKRQKELENVLPCVPLPEPKYQLRRTSSSLF